MSIDLFYLIDNNFIKQFLKNTRLRFTLKPKVCHDSMTTTLHVWACLVKGGSEEVRK